MIIFVIEVPRVVKFIETKCNGGFQTLGEKGIESCLLSMEFAFEKIKFF
jgi:hypothetical protein